MAEPATTDRASYARILTSTSVIGGASVVNILIGIVRTKAIALLLGPAGIGLIGLLTSLVSAAATVVQLGMGSVGTRQIAEANATGDGARLHVARRALVLATLALAAVGGLGVVALRDVLATYALRNPELAGEVAWVGLAVALSVAAAAQTALIRGMRRIKELALLQIGGALATTLVGLPVVWRFGADAIPYYVVLVPLANFALGHWFVARLPKPAPVPVRLPQLTAQWRMFVRLGLPLMGAGVVATLVQLWIKADVKGALGVDTLGFYVAAYTIAMQYVGVVLNAMGADYYPRLTGVIDDHAAARRVVNQQAEVALLLAGAAVIAMFALAPWVIHLLYAESFAPAADLLRWMALGTLLKVMSWPMGFVLLAAGAGRTFFVKEVAILAIMAVGTSVLIGPLGLDGAGVAYTLAYAVNVPVLYLLARRRIGFAWAPVVPGLAVAVAGACGVTALALVVAPAAAVPVGLALTAAYGLVALARLHRTGAAAPLLAKLRLRPVVS